MFFELVSISFAIVPDYSKEYTTKENKNWTSFAPKLNLNHNKSYVSLNLYKSYKTSQQRFFGLFCRVKVVNMTIFSQMNLNSLLLKFKVTKIPAHYEEVI